MIAKSLRITVFDFAAEDCMHTAGAIRAYFSRRGIPAQVVEFTEMQPFVYDFKENKDADTPYGMAFVGVDNMMGAETARNIREMDARLPLFLVSQVGDFGLEGFRLAALDYLTKPVSPERIGSGVERIGSSGRGFRVSELLGEEIFDKNNTRMNTAGGLK